MYFKVHNGRYILITRANLWKTERGYLDKNGCFLNIKGAFTFTEMLDLFWYNGNIVYV